MHFESYSFNSDLYYTTIHELWLDQNLFIFLHSHTIIFICNGLFMVYDKCMMWICVVICEASELIIVVHVQIRSLQWPQAGRKSTFPFRSATVGVTMLCLTSSRKTASLDHPIIHITNSCADQSWTLETSTDTAIRFSYDVDCNLSLKLLALLLQELCQRSKWFYLPRRVVCIASCSDRKELSACSSCWCLWGSWSGGRGS